MTIGFRICSFFQLSFMIIFILFRMYGSLLFIFSKTNGCYLYFSNKVFQLWTYRYISPCGGALSGISSKVPSFELTFPFQSHYTKIRWWEKLMICFTSQHVNYDAEYALTRESYLCCWSWYSVLNVLANQLLKSLEHNFLPLYKANSSHKCIFW